MNALCGLFLIVSLLHQEQTPTHTAAVDTAVQPGEFFDAHMDKYACAEYYERRAELKSYQQKEYFDILANLCSRDLLSAIIDYFRMQNQIEYSLNHNPVYCKDPGGYTIVFSIDWSYPRDPWEREAKRY